DLAKEIEPRLGRELMAVAEFGDGGAIDVLHHKIRQAVFIHAAVEQARDVGMIERGQNLSLVAEAAQDVVGIHSALDQLDGHLLPILIISASRQIDLSHPARAELRQKPVMAKLTPYD